MREKMMEHAIRLFERKGFSETSVQELVDAVGVTKGAFYYYFTSKEELLCQIHLDYIESMLVQQQHIVEEKEQTCREKLTGLVQMLIRSIAEEGDRARIFFREMRHLGAEHLETIGEKRDLFRIRFQSLIEAGVRDGEFRSELRADLVTLAILGMCNWSYTWYDPCGEVMDEALAVLYTELILHGIGDKEGVTA
ncbi:TetR/AcrR family transcriptional regulator [Brevibacillus dissolubilis]|uniref:TetR/AcrR family transcriptional regulator n=1 Tax=Brevibacillus dissolubilis TaxID=1844116 RepID=UPI001117107D|nr:TetR/AcrR family transcriptional regulator [Brevibacillus dissolubilis]